MSGRECRERSRADLELATNVAAGPEVLRFDTVDGVLGPDSFRTAELLLLRVLHDAAPGRHLSVQANYGVVGVGLAAVADAVRATEASVRRATCCRRNAARNGAAVDATVVADLRRLRGGYDSASYAPDSHAPISVATQRIADALSLLRPGGHLYVAADAHAGRSRFEDALDTLAGDVQTVATAGDCAVLEATRPARMTAESFVSPTRVDCDVAGADLTLWSVPGLFAAGDVDHGTRLLAETAEVADGDRVLDLCCGTGVLGLVAAATADCAVTLTDDDRVATRAAACSVRASGVDARVVTADGVGGVRGGRFDRVLCNPPTHAGDGVLAALLDGARQVLAPGGDLWLVHHRALDLRPHLRGFASVSTVEHGAEHEVVRAVD